MNRIYPPIIRVIGDSFLQLIVMAGENLMRVVRVFAAKL